MCDNQQRRASVGRRNRGLRGSTATNLRSVAAECSVAADLAEQRYQEQQRSKKYKQKRTYDSMKVDLIVQLKKNKSVRAGLKNWWLFRRLVNVPEKKMKQLILSAAVVAHVLSRDRRTQEVGSGLYKIGLLVVLPFMVPPAIVVGIPTLVLLMPFLTLVWAIITLNRHAKKVLLCHQRVKRAPEAPSMTQRFSSMMQSTSSSLGFSKNSMEGYKRLGALGLAWNQNHPMSAHTATTTSKNKPHPSVSKAADGSITSATSAITTTSTTAASVKSVSFALDSPTLQSTPNSAATRYKKPRSKSWSFRPRVSFGSSSTSSSSHNKPPRRNSSNPISQ